MASTFRVSGGERVLSDRSGLLAILDKCTEVLIFALIIFSPWAFGTTQDWSIRCMNLGGYVLGALLLAKILAGGAMSFRSLQRWPRRVTFLLLGLTACLLAYTLVAAINAEFTYLPEEFRQEPHPHLKWLPHSLDRDATWKIFWNWLALACVFWAIHDWLISDISPEGSRRNGRLRRLVGVLAANAALVSLQGILQRTSGTAHLLWFKATHENPTAAAQFGPYAYRSNAAQLFNLIWPAAVGLWWHCQAQNKRRTQRYHWLLPLVMLLIAGSLVSMSRGGVAVTIIQVTACAVLFLARGKLTLRSRFTFGAVLIATLGAAFYLGGDPLLERLRQGANDPLSGRGETYRLARQMAEDYPWFGVGPGAYASVFQLYRHSPTDYWPAQLHNDWLEYLITFGRVGCFLMLASATLVAWRTTLPGGLYTHRDLPLFLWIAIGGCLLHARFDFPLQIYSIQFVFVMLTAVLFSISRPSSPASTNEVTVAHGLPRPS